MKFEIYHPSPVLSEYIHYYWLLEADRSLSPGEDIHRVIPNGLMEVLLNYGDDFTCTGNNAPEDIQPRVTICGQKKTFFDIRQLGHTKLISILFKPAGASALLPFRLSEIVNFSLDLDDIFSNQGDRLLNRLTEAGSSLEKIGVIEQFLMGIIKREHRKDYYLMEGIIDEINGSYGQVTVDDLCFAFDLNAKSIERKFSEYIGVPPKTFLRIVRFQSVLQKYNSFHGSLTSLGYECGYYDQSHFIKDVKSFTGHSPKNFFSCEPVYSDYFV
ncbi:MAG: AraC family transcriptional regulator [bacterium]|nr:AraC family transcriptional regulator [bacterium]